ncbi:hypothetical protein TNCV_3036991 [Trichonephila clavipes]|nr:hypothetical protein TNCV_3036991 [Trichonephila clavipes]
MFSGEKIRTRRAALFHTCDSCNEPSFNGQLKTGAALNSCAMGAGDSCERIRRFPGKLIGKTESGGRPAPKGERQARQLSPRSGTLQ